MLGLISPSLKRLAESMDKPLYVVGGAVRCALINGERSLDVDLAGPFDVEEFIPKVQAQGFTIKAEYPRTHTLMFEEDGDDVRYEFTSFRSEVYDHGGAHTPTSTERTDDIVEDAKRRDFKCNAVYFDIKKGEYVDPLNGIYDIENKVLDTVKDANKVFASDGLRLLRLARFAGELGFTPTENVLFSASAYAENITDISGERIYDELMKMLVSDQKYPYSDPAGHYKALKICQEIGVLKYIFPELSLGAGMPQRKDFHRYDVLEHSFRALLYSEPSVRLAALLHDIGKSVVFLRDGTYHYHATTGASIAKERLLKLKAPRSVLDDTCWLILNHMYDLCVDEPAHDVKKFITKNWHRIDRLLLIKEADIKASDPDLIPRTVVRWRAIIRDLKSSGAPISLKDLKIDGDDLGQIGLKGKAVGMVLEKILDQVLDEPSLNEREILLSMAVSIKNELI